MTTASKVALAVTVALLVVDPTFAQKARPKPKTKPTPAMIFAVLNDGKLIEPVAAIESGKIIRADTGPNDDKASTNFVNRYYSAKTSYSLIFGGKAAGSSTVIKSNAGTECGGNSAEITTKSGATQLKGLVMALATNAKIAKPGSGVRRRPTAEERTEIEALVRAELKNQGTSDAALKNLRYHNLTALDVDNDGIAEFVGSYWVAPTKDERRTLFFIAEKGSDGKYSLTHHDYESIKPDNVMSENINDLDTGILHELLLDVFDYDNDGTSEIFTISKAFEGNNYYAYKKQDGKWTQVLENYVYRCAY